MFEAAEVGRKLSKRDYKAQVPRLRVDLLEAQVQLREAPFPVIVLFAGVDAAGKGETVNLLNEWMDPRWIVTRGYLPPTQEEQERPRLWRYWRDLPPRGRIALFLSAWYSSPIRAHVGRRIGDGALDAMLDEIAAFERTLAEDGAVILKFWMHLGRSQQKKRLERLEKDPLQRWRVTKRQWRHWRMFDRFVATADRAIRRTSTALAPWHIVEGADERYRSVAVATEVRDAIRRGLRRARGSRRGGPVAGAARGGAIGPVRQTLRNAAQAFNVLDGLDLGQRLSDRRFERALAEQQGRLNLLQRKARAGGVSTVVVFEGWDAAGKGGAIRRVTRALDAQDYQVVPIAAPTDEERARHYLWRFWRQLSRAGRITIFDRSWYGRVLVERVEGLIGEAEYQRAFGEIAHFEEQLVGHGILVLKFWLHVSSEEQLRRFKERETTRYKQWKITREDWRNRSRRDDYTLAVNEMVARTSTAVAPWTLVEGDDKNFARVKVLQAIGDGLARRLVE